MVGSYTTVFVGTMAQYEAEKSNFSSFTPTVFDVCYFTGHEMSDYDMAYDNGFASTGTRTSRCLHDGCENSDVKEIAPVFVALGYSVKDDGTALMGGFEINSPQANEYNSYAQANGLPTIKYGVIMSNATGIIIEDGRLTSDHGIQIEANTLDYAKINYTVNNFTAQASIVNAELVIALYVDLGGEIQFIQSSTRKSTSEASVDEKSVSVNTISLKTIVDMTIETLSNDLEIITDDTEKAKIQAVIDALKLFSIEPTQSV